MDSEKADKPTVVHAERTNEQFAAIAQAGMAAEHEKTMSLWQGLKKYKKAVGWSVLLSSALVMEGFDTSLIGGLISFPAFQKKYGKPNPDGNGYNLTAPWQAGLSNGTLVGEIFGLFLSAYLVDKFGYRKIVLGGLAAICAFIFIPFFAPSIIVLEVGEILCGIAWGVFQTLTNAYAVEVCPVILRSYLTSYINMCWVFGQFISSGVIRGMLGRTDVWSYRIPFAIQWIWPVPLFCAVLFAPESPWYLVRKGRIDEAKKSLERLTSKEEKENLGHTLAMMVHTTELELAVARKNAESSYFDCFKGTDLRRTEIVCMVSAVPVLSGNYINTVYFLEQAGMSTTDAFDLGLGQTGMAFVGTALSWVLMSYLGRRTIYLLGITILGTNLFIVGCLSLAPADQKGPQWAQGILFMISIFFYDLMIGPVGFSLVAELSSTRLRQKSIALARNFYNLIGLAASTILPYQMNQTAWNWKGKLGFFWFGSCLLCFIWIFFRLPEPKGRTFAELDLLFEMRVPARKFKTTMVDPYDVDQVEILIGEHDEKVNSA